MTVAIGSPGISRVYFLDEKGAEAKAPDALAKIAVVSLASHAENVRRMVATWRDDDRSPFHDALVLAAEHHDDAKPGKFALLWEPKSGFAYSFSGHRFYVATPAIRASAYAARLIREHHTFATEDVVRAAAELVREGTIPKGEAHRFAHDLYVLEVCDNLAADVETRVCLPAMAKDREFVECTLRSANEGEHRYVVEPWPFDKAPLVLAVERRSIRVDGALGETLAENLKDAPKGESVELRAFTKAVARAADEKGEPWETTEVTLCSR